MFLDFAFEKSPLRIRSRVVFLSRSFRKTVGFEKTTHCSGLEKKKIMQRNTKDSKDA